MRADRLRRLQASAPSSWRAWARALVARKLRFEIRREPPARYPEFSEVTVAGNGEKWRWADPQGTQRIVHFDELRAALASGTLPPYTLVWQPGMAEWQPAYLVGELATAAISAREGVIPNVPPPPLHIVAVQAEYERRGDDPRGAALGDQAPPPPVHQYAAIAAAAPPHLVRARPPSNRAAAPGRPAPGLTREAPSPETAAARVAPVPAGGRPAQGAATARASLDDDEDGVLQTIVARPVMVPPASAAAQPETPLAAVMPPPGSSRRTVGPPPDTSGTSGSAPLSRPAGRATLAPPPRKSYPAPMGHAPPSPSLRHTIPGPGVPKVPLASTAPPIAVPPPQQGGAGSAAGGPTHWPPFGGAAAGSAAAPSTPANGEGAGLSALLTEPTGGRPYHPDEELPSFPLELTETPDAQELSGASLVRDAESRPATDDGDAQLGSRFGWSTLQRRMTPWARRARAGVHQTVLPRLREGVVYVREHPKDPKVLGALGAGAFLLTLGVGAMFASGGREEPESPVGHALAPAVAVSTARREPEVGRRDPEPAPSTDELSPAAAPAGRALAPCRLSGDAVRLAPKAFKDVPLEVAIAPSSERAWLGYALDAASPRGLAIDTTTSVATPAFTARAHKVRAVVPATVRGKPTFAVSAEGKRDQLQAWRPVASEPPHVVGWTGQALAIARRATDAPRTLWSLEGAAPAEAIRAVVAGDHEVVAFRREGAIWMGLLRKDQTPEGPLVRVAGAGAPPGSPVGSPALATNGQAVAVAFADRASPAEPWSVRLGSAASDALPTQTTAFKVPTGGPGGAALAPTLGGLPDGRWLVVWTEGSGGRHDVRGQTLAPDLSPLGSPFAVAHPEDNAGQGALALSADRGFVAYLRLTDQGYEVWGTGLDCR